MIPDPTSTLLPPGIGINGKLFQYLPQAVLIRLEILPYLLRYGGAPIFQKGLCIFIFENLFETKFILFVLRTTCSNPYVFKHFPGNAKPMFTPIFNPTLN